VFDVEPSYYAWMQNGDFPRYTKKVLENIWNAYKSQKKEVKTKEATEGEGHVKREFKKKVDEPGKPITNDMLKGLQDRFGK